MSILDNFESKLIQTENMKKGNENEKKITYYPMYKFPTCWIFY